MSIPVADKYEVHQLYLQIENKLPNEKRKVAKEIIRHVLEAQKENARQFKLDEPR